MLIRNVITTDTSIRIFDVDGSSIHLIAEDVLLLERWIQANKGVLLDAERRAQRQVVKAPSQEEIGDE